MRTTGYVAPIRALRPADQGFSAFESAGRRLGAGYREAAADYAKIGELQAREIEAKRWPFDILELADQQARARAGRGGGVSRIIDPMNQYPGTGSFGGDSGYRADRAAEDAMSMGMGAIGDFLGGSKGKLVSAPNTGPNMTIEDYQNWLNAPAMPGSTSVTGVPIQGMNQLFDTRSSEGGVVPFIGDVVSQEPLTFQNPVSAQNGVTGKYSGDTVQGPATPLQNNQGQPYYDFSQGGGSTGSDWTPLAPSSTFGPLGDWLSGNNNTMGQPSDTGGDVSF